ncbi:MAG: GntR family transcriptional regulator [Clostridia bacterium]|nr:GntR family transcriptional regulator [Clostridia bacterium]
MFVIDAMSRCPVYEQLISQIERFILVGLIKEGEQLPSVRALSVSLSVNPNTIQKAYSDLDSRKIIFSVPGKGCFVSEDAKQLLSEYRRKRLVDLEEMLNELKIAGISKDEVNEVIEKIFDERR